MSVSIDEHPADDHESAQSVLAGWLDDYQAGRCERTDMEEAFMSVCASDPEAPWDALSLLDRYQRLGRVDAEVARDLKSRISQIAVGAPKSERETQPKPVTTGSRWRKLEAEHDPESINTDDIEPAPTAVRSSPPQPPPIATRNEAADEDEDEELDEDSEDEAAPSAPLRSHSAFRQPPPAAERAMPPRRSAPAREVEAPPPRRARAASPAAAPRAPASAPGRRVLRDRYELLSALGRGNTSTVYRALDRHRANLSESARYVAVKLLNATYDTKPEALAELEREFHQAQSLSHPNIATVFDLDRDGSTYFVVMELLEGESLAGVLRRLAGRPMARKNALAVIGAIGAALAHAHRRDIVHGDLKPRNVMITYAGEVRVLEFGFARSRSLAGELDDEHSNVSIGTPAYASAERVHGMNPDPSDDVYSLACIAYELLSGRHPFGGRSAFLAKAHGRRAQRAPGLAHRQWHALQRALAWDRPDRKIDIVDFLAALGTGELAQHPVPPELLAIPDDLGARRLRKLGAFTAVIAAVALAVYFVTRIPPPVQNIDVTTAVPKPPPSDTEVLATPPSGTAASKPEPTAPGRSSESAARSESTTPRNAPDTNRQASAPREEIIAPSESTAAESTAATAASGGAAGATSTRPAATGTVEFAKDTFVVTEGESAVSVEVRRTGSTRGVLSFRWRLRSNSAEAGADFAAIGPTVEQIPSGERTATILVPIVNDSLIENTELFLVELEPIDEGVRIGEVGHAAVIVVDDD